jgi:hypothetical protein
VPISYTRFSLYSRLTGPYAPAVLRFQISFPSSYPALPPLVTFSTDVFHPLLTPLTTYTHTTASSDTDTVSATDDERLPPGGFSLRHGFPHWFGRARRSTVGSRDVSGSAVESPAQSVTPVHSTVENATTGGHGSPLPATGVSIVTILEYIRSSFSEEAVLDSVPLEAAANPGAHHAWRAYRGPALSAQQPLSPVSSISGEGPALGRNRKPGEWNWDGVWEERVKRAVNASLSESVLYGSATGDDIVSSRHQRAQVLIQLLTESDSIPARRRRDYGKDKEVFGRGHCENSRSLSCRAGLKEHVPAVSMLSLWVGSTFGEGRNDLGLSTNSRWAPSLHVSAEWPVRKLCCNHHIHHQQHR